MVRILKRDIDEGRLRIFQVIFDGRIQTILTSDSHDDSQEFVTRDQAFRVELVIRSLFYDIVIIEKGEISIDRVLSLDVGERELFDESECLEAHAGGHQSYE